MQNHEIHERHEKVLVCFVCAFVYLVYFVVHKEVSLEVLQVAQMIEVSLEKQTPLHAASSRIFRETREIRAKDFLASIQGFERIVESH